MCDVGSVDSEMPVRQPRCHLQQEMAHTGQELLKEVRSGDEVLKWSACKEYLAIR